MTKRPEDKKFPKWSCSIGETWGDAIAFVLANSDCGIEPVYAAPQNLLSEKVFSHYQIFCWANHYKKYRKKVPADLNDYITQIRRQIVCGY